MDDRRKTCMSLFFFSSTFIMPLIGLAVGWIAVDFETGALAALIIFAVFFLLSGIFLALVRVPTWLTVSLPFTFGFLYAIIPDFVPGPFDDAAAVVAGAILSFVLWIKKQPDVPKWVVLPLTSVGLYVLVGGLIPGPIDEMLVTAIAAGISVYGATRLPEESDQQGEHLVEEAGIPSEEDMIDAVFEEENLAVAEDADNFLEDDLQPGPQALASEDIIILGEPEQTEGDLPEALE